MLLGFKPRFKDPIQIGTKVFTMRGKRKNEPKIGETLYMYCGLRTKNCEKISDKETLVSTQRVRLHITAEPNCNFLIVYVDGKKLNERQKSQFVKFDGFKNTMDFINYWVESSTGKKRKKNACYKIGGFLTLYHWTDLKF